MAGKCANRDNVEIMEPTNIPMESSLEVRSQVELLSTELKNDYWQLCANPLSGRIQYGQQSGPPAGGNGNLEASLGYRRCFDFDPTDSSGQDYAIVRGDQHYVAGVLADGVSQSYYGNLAAGHLSEHLLQFLWSCRERPVAVDEMESVLKRLETEGQKLVELHRSPDHLPAMHREALNRSRENGSQTVFSAFVLHTKSQHLTVYQVGDVDAVVVQLRNTTVVKADAQGRWSTAGKSQHLLQVTPFEDVHSLLVRSDGFGSAWEDMLHQGSNQRRQFFEHLAAKQAGKDDVSFILIKNLGDARPVPGSKKLVATGAIDPRRQKSSTFASGAATAERFEAAETPDGRSLQRLWARGLRIRATLACLSFLLVGSVVGSIGGVFWATTSKYPGQLLRRVGLISPPPSPPPPSMPTMPRLEQQGPQLPLGHNLETPPQSQGTRSQPSRDNQSQRSQPSRTQQQRTPPPATPQQPAAQPQGQEP